MKHTTIRDNALSREEEISYLNSKGIDLSWDKAKYSINKGLWGTSVGGDETLTSNLALPEEAYPSAIKNNNETLAKLSFKKGYWWLLMVLKILQLKIFKT